MISSPLSSPWSGSEDSIFESSVSEDSILGSSATGQNSGTDSDDNIQEPDLTQTSSGADLDYDLEGSNTICPSSEGVEADTDFVLMGKKNNVIETSSGADLDYDLEGSNTIRPSSEGVEADTDFVLMGKKINVIEISDDEDDVPSKKRPRIAESTEDRSAIEYVDPRDKFCIRGSGAIGAIQKACGDPRCPRGDCFIDDACKLYLYLPLMFHSEPIVWMVPVERDRGGRLRLSGMTHLLHIAAADRVIYLTWRIGLGWIDFNWNEWQVLPGEDIILRPKHEEIGENRPGMKEVMQRLYASMIHEGRTLERVPKRFR